MYYDFPGDPLQVVLFLFVLFGAAMAMATFTAWGVFSLAVEVVHQARRRGRERLLLGVVLALLVGTVVIGILFIYSYMQQLQGIPTRYRYL